MRGQSKCSCGFTREPTGITPSAVGSELFSEPRESTSMMDDSLCEASLGSLGAKFRAMANSGHTDHDEK